MELGIEWDLEEELESLGINLDHRGCEDEEINSLRELRDRYNDLAKETQKLIDKKVLDLYEVPDLTNKYVRIRYPKTENTVYIHVRYVDRLSFGINLKGDSLFTYDGFDDFRLDVDSCHSIRFENIKHIDILSKEEFDKIIMTYLNKCHKLLVEDEV